MENRAHAVAIAAYVRRRGAAFSGEILDEFAMSESTLRRRRPALERLGVRFVENGRGSFYVTEPLARHLPSTTEQKAADEHGRWTPAVGASTSVNPDTPDTHRAHAPGREVPGQSTQSAHSAGVRAREDSDVETEAIRRADRPGLEGGINFWDLWRLEWDRRGGNPIDP